jgi:hypothetical protein
LQSNATALAQTKALLFENLELNQSEGDYPVNLTLARHDERCPHAYADKQS